MSDDDKPKPVYTPPPPPVEIMATSGEVTALANRISVMETRLERIEHHLAPLIGLDERFAAMARNLDVRLKIIEDQKYLAPLDSRIAKLEHQHILSSGSGEHPHDH